jgi:hypothetical protein
MDVLLYIIFANLKRTVFVTASAAHSAKTHLQSLTVTTTTHTTTQPQAYYLTKSPDPSRSKHYDHFDMHYMHGPALVVDFHVYTLGGSTAKLPWLALTTQARYQIT